MWWESISERDKASGGLQKLIPDIVDYMDCMDRIKLHGQDEFSDLHS